MWKLINIAAVLCLALISPAYAASTIGADAFVAPKQGVAKISSGLDSVVGAAQSASMVKVGIAANTSGHSVDSSVAANASLGAVADAADDIGNLDGRAILAGLALMAVIALRRIRSN